MAAGLLITGSGFADESGPFISLKGGHLQTSFQIPAGVTTEEPNFTWALGGGYRFNQYSGIEGGFRDFGTVRLNGSQIATTKMTGWTYGGFLSYPITENFEAVARAGWVSGKLEATNTTYNFSRTTWRTEPYWGLGLVWKIGSRVSLGIDWTLFSSPDKTTATDPIAIELGARYRF